MGFTVKRVPRRVLRRGSEKGGFQKVPSRPPCRVRPVRRAPYWWLHIVSRSRRGSKTRNCLVDAFRDCSQGNLKKFQGAPKGRQQKGETGPGTHIFADFCRFSLIFGSLCKSRDLGVADFRRKPQETADFRRKPQKTADFCRNRFLPFAVSVLARS